MNSDGGVARTHGTAEVCDACLRRTLLLGVLAPRIQAVLDSRSRNPRSVLALDDADLLAAVGGDRRAAEAFLGEFDAEVWRTRLAEGGAQAVCRHSRAYPTRLLQLTDAPAALFLIGDVARVLPLVARGPLVAVVGTRRPSPYGLEMATELGRGLAAAGVTVVSGLALGIDAAAHAGCLAGGGTTVAVLGGGSDVPYPRTNERVYDQIATQGLLMSEMPPGQRPFRWSFPARNRIMAGLCDATVVVEAARSSGSLITTDFAGDLGRVVAAVPGHATSVGARGSNELLRSGAAVINRPEDVLDEIFGARLDEQLPAARVEPVGLEAEEQAVLYGVERELAIDGICEAVELPVHRVRGVLARLEDAGHVRRDGFGGYIRRAKGL
ncbi:MAG: DNA-processing protein DprA [Thermoleophilaceae bacterium]